MPGRKPRRESRLPSERFYKRRTMDERLRRIEARAARRLPPEGWDVGKPISKHMTKTRESSIDRVQRLLNGTPADRMVARDMLRRHLRYWGTKSVAKYFRLHPNSNFTFQEVYQEFEDVFGRYIQGRNINVRAVVEGIGFHSGTKKPKS